MDLAIKVRDHKLEIGPFLLFCPALMLTRRQPYWHPFRLSPGFECNDSPHGEFSGFQYPCLIPPFFNLMFKWS